MLNDHLGGQDLALVDEQVVQQAKFQGGQTDGCAIGAAQLLAIYIHCQVAEGEIGGERLAAASEHSADAAQHLVAIQAGEVDVQEDEGRLLRLPQGQRALAIGSVQDLIALAAQGESNQHR